MNDDALLPDLSPEMALASAYLDATADPAGRDEVEASPELLRLVATFTSLRIALADLPPVPVANQDAAVAAALAEFDALGSAAATSAAAATVVAIRQRARWSRVVIAAAASLVIGVAGVAAMKSIGDNSSKTSASHVERTGVDGAPTAAGGAADVTDAATQQTIGVINGSADALPAYDRPEDLRTLPSSATIDDKGVVVESSVKPEVPTLPHQPVVGPLTFPFTCPLSPTQLFIAEILWRGSPAAAVRDTVTGVTQAIDPQCSVLVSVEP